MSHGTVRGTVGWVILEWAVFTSSCLFTLSTSNHILNAGFGTHSRVYCCE